MPVVGDEGLRRGEVFGLRLADADLDASRIHIRQALVSVAFKLTILQVPPDRVIDLDPGTDNPQRNQRQRQGRRAADCCAGYLDDDLMFCKEQGDLCPQTFSQAFERLVSKTELPSIRLDELRCTHATIALRAVDPPKAISDAAAMRPGFHAQAVRPRNPGDASRRGASGHSTLRTRLLTL